MHSGMMKCEDENRSDEQIQEEESPRKKKVKKPSIRLQNQKSGHWSQDQKINYIIFLEFHKDKFQFKQQRRTEKIFKIMSNIIQTRTPDQCRSHHQKMEKHYKDLEAIIAHHKASIRPEIYQVEYQKFLKNYNKKSSFFEQSPQQQQVEDRKPIILIPKNPPMGVMGNQLGFQSFSSPVNEYTSQFNILNSIHQLYLQCFQQNTSPSKQPK